MNPKSFALCLIGIWSLAPVRADIPLPAFCARLDVRDNLSNNYVMAVSEDGTGSMWFATEEGLNRFDGIRITSFYKHTGILAGNELNDVLADRDEPVVWIATQRAGLCRYNYETGESRTFRHSDDAPDGLITNDITHIEQADDGNLWISTYFGGLEQYNKRTGKFTHYNAETVPGMNPDHIYEFAVGADGNIYIGHYADGFTILNPARRQARSLRHREGDPNSLPGNGVNDVCRDARNNIWVGTDGGLALYRPVTNDFTVVRGTEGKGLPPGRIHAILLCRDNKLLVAPEFGGVWMLNLDSVQFSPSCGSRFVPLPGAEELSGISVRDMHEDKFGNLWIGTYGRGVLFVSDRDSRFGVWRCPDVLSGKSVPGLCFDQNGRLWAGTEGGGADLLRNGRRIGGFDRELPSLNVLTAYCDSGGDVWIGTYDGGALRYGSAGEGRFSRLALGRQPTLEVRCFCQQGDRIWIGTGEGVYVVRRSDLQVLAHYSAKDLLPEDYMRSLCFDDKGRLWVGTFGAGVVIYDAGMNPVAHYKVETGFVSNMINHLFRDSRGRMWAATSEGLVRFDPTDDKPTPSVCFSRREGLSNDYMRAVTEDGAGNIWASSNTGIGCIVGGDSVLLDFDHRDGVSAGNFLNGSVACDARGTICFGSTEGICYFRPDKLLARAEPPSVRFTEARVYTDKSLDKETDSIVQLTGSHPFVLDYRHNSFVVSFCVPDYSIVDHVEYSYKLLGLDNDWFTTDARNGITFRHLPPGDYGLQVRARFRNREWGPPTAGLNIRITPPLWLTWWAKTAYCLLGLGLLWLAMRRYRHRIRRDGEIRIERKTLLQRQEINNERLRFYTNIAHELRTPLTLILGPLEDLRSDAAMPPGASRKIGVVHQNAVQLLNLINQLLEFRKTETQNRPLKVSYDDLSQRIEEVGLLFRDSNANRATKIELDIEPDVMLCFDGELITLVLNNLLSNAMKYTPEGTVTLSLHVIEEEGIRYAEIGVRDTGYGIAPEALGRIYDRYYQVDGKHQASGTGIGLALVKNLVILHQAAIDVESRPNAGTAFRVRLRMDNTYPQAVQEPVRSVPPVAAAETPSDSRPIVLVVEDNADIRSYIADSLSEHYRIVTAAEGAEGERLVMEYIPDIVVSDIMMPVMDGVELCRRLKGDVRTSHIPVILLTAKDTPSDRADGYDAGADSYITKPFSSSVLLSRIRNLLESRRKIAHLLTSSAATRQEHVEAVRSLMPLDNEFLQHVNAIIEENLSTEKIDIALLADKLCMSPSTLYRKLKGLVGISANEYVRKIRLRNAAELLRSGKYNISETAWQVGMGSAVYFRQCFKEEYGISPSDFRRRETGVQEDPEQ